MCPAKNWSAGNMEEKKVCSSLPVAPMAMSLSRGSSKIVGSQA